MIRPVVAAFLLCVALTAQAASPERHVEGNVLVSQNDPKVRIEVPSGAQYLGADRWVLYNIADCELHVFVEADAQKNVQRLYWIQFEQYLPSKPDLHHTYDSPRHAQLGGMDFYVDTWVRSKDERTTPDSDLEHVQALIHEKGYHLPAGMMSVRLVHLLDAAKRKELMIIYSEDVASTGFTADELNTSAHDRWPAIQDGLVERAKAKIVLQ